VQITDEMRQKIANEVQSSYTVVFHEKLNEAFTLEKKLQRGVTQGKTKEELKELIDEIAKLKREALDARIDALNTVRAILPEETWNKINQEWYK
jgi:vancomycin resistance protein YoaR